MPESFQPHRVAFSGHEQKAAIITALEHFAPLPFKSRPMFKNRLKSGSRASLTHEPHCRCETKNSPRLQVACSDESLKIVESSKVGIRVALHGAYFWDSGIPIVMTRRVRVL
jgi:hypothetical protein